MLLVCIVNDNILALQLLNSYFKYIPSPSGKLCTVKLKTGRLLCMSRSGVFLLFQVLLQSNAQTISCISTTPFQFRVGELLSLNISLISVKEMSRNVLDISYVLNMIKCSQTSHRATLRRLPVVCCNLQLSEGREESEFHLDPARLQRMTTGPGTPYLQPRCMHLFH